MPRACVPIFVFYSPGPLLFCTYCSSYYKVSGRCEVVHQINVFLPNPCIIPHLYVKSIAEAFWKHSSAIVHQLFLDLKVRIQFLSLHFAFIFLHQIICKKKVCLNTFNSKIHYINIDCLFRLQSWGILLQSNVPLCTITLRKNKNSWLHFLLRDAISHNVFVF